MPVVEFTKTKYPLTRLPSTPQPEYPQPYADLFAIFNTFRAMWMDLDASFAAIEGSIAGFVEEAPIDGTSYVRKDAGWVPESGGGGGASWGSITGTLSAQTDLATALAGKEPTIIAGTTADYWRGDKSWQPLPSPGIPEAPNDGQQYGRQSLGWTVVTGGGGGGSTGGNIVVTGDRNSSSNSFRDYTVFGKIPGGAVLSVATGIKFSLWLRSAGNFKIGATKILTTALGSLTVTASTTVNFGGVANPTIVNPTPGTFFRLTTDNTAIAIDASHDYWLAVYFDVTSANDLDVGVIDPISNLLGNYAGGDQTGVATIPVSASQRYVFSNVISV